VSYGIDVLPKNIYILIAFFLSVYTFSAGAFALTFSAPNESYSCFWKTFILCSFVADMRNK